MAGALRRQARFGGILKNITPCDLLLCPTAICGMYLIGHPSLLPDKRSEDDCMDNRDDRRHPRNG